MAIAGVLVQTKSGKGEEVARRLAGFPGASVHGVVDAHRVVVVMEGGIEEIERTTSRVVNEVEDVLGAYPVYISYEDERLAPS